MSKRKAFIQLAKNFKARFENVVKGGSCAVSKIDALISLKGDADAAVNKEDARLEKSIMKAAYGALAGLIGTVILTFATLPVAAVAIGLPVTIGFLFYASRTQHIQNKNKAGTEDLAGSIDTTVAGIIQSDPHAASCSKALNAAIKEIFIVSAEKSELPQTAKTMANLMTLR